MQLEIIGFNIESCMAAQQAGADRIELCAGPGEGGTTPSCSFIQLAREKLSVDLYVMIRPRGGDFLYSEDDLRIMRKDVALCREMGCDGIVTGVLTREGKIDKKNNRELAELAYPLGTTFHRAFDRVADPFEALEDVIESGFERILTSGLKPRAADATPLLSQLIKKSDGRIVIMPGSGVTSQNILQIAESTCAKEFHSSAGIRQRSRMDFLNSAMEESLEYACVNQEEVLKMAALLKEHASRLNQ